MDVFQQNIAQGCYQFTLLLCQAEYVQNWGSHKPAVVLPCCEHLIPYLSVSLPEKTPIFILMWHPVH